MTRQQLHDQLSQYGFAVWVSEPAINGYFVEAYAATEPISALEAAGFIAVDGTRVEEVGKRRWILEGMVQEVVA